MNGRASQLTAQHEPRMEDQTELVAVFDDELDELVAARDVPTQLEVLDLTLERMGYQRVGDWRGFEGGGHRCEVRSAET